MYQNQSKQVMKIRIPYNGNNKCEPTVLFLTNKPVIIIHGDKKGTCMLIDVADRTVIKKEAEKILKCKDLIIEIQRMWNVTAKVIPVITGATGTISKSLRQYLSNIPGKQEIRELQKNSHIGLCTYSTESANVKVQNIFHGRFSSTCNTNCKYWTAATLYTLETWFVSGI